MIIIYFIAGSIFSILFLSIGVIIGYWLGSKQLESKIDQIKHKIEINKIPKNHSGPVKVITAKEITLEREKSFVEKLKGYVEPDRPLV